MSLSQWLDEEKARQTMGERNIQTQETACSKAQQWKKVKGGQYCWGGVSEHKSGATWVEKVGWNLTTQSLVLSCSIVTDCESCSPLDCKEIQPVHSKGDQSWVFFGRNDAKAETPVLWPPHAKVAKSQTRLSKWTELNWTANLWTVAHSVPLSLGFSRQEYWSGLPFPSPEVLPDQGLNLQLLCLLPCRWIPKLLSHCGSPNQALSERKVKSLVMSDSLWPHGCSIPGSSVHGIFQAKVLEWVAISFSRGSSQPKDQTRVSHIADRRFTVWATREA